MIREQNEDRALERDDPIKNAGAVVEGDLHSVRMVFLTLLSKTGQLGSPESAFAVAKKVRRWASLMSLFLPGKFTEKVIALPVALVGKARQAVAR